MQEDGTFIVRGDADLEDCDVILGLQLDEEDQILVRIQYITMAKCGHNL